MLTTRSPLLDRNGWARAPRTALAVALMLAGGGSAGCGASVALSVAQAPGSSGDLGAVSEHPASDGARSAGDARREGQRRAADAQVVLGLGALGLAAAGGAVGIGLAVSSDRAVAEANRLTRRDQRRHAALAAQVDHERTGMAVCFGLGAALALAGAWALLGDDGPGIAAAIEPSGSGWVIRW